MHHLQFVDNGGVALGSQWKTCTQCISCDVADINERPKALARELA